MPVRTRSPDRAVNAHTTIAISKTTPIVMKSRLRGIVAVAGDAVRRDEERGIGSHDGRPGSNMRMKRLFDKPPSPPATPGEGAGHETVAVMGTRSTRLLRVTLPIVRYNSRSVTVRA